MALYHRTVTHFFISRHLLAHHQKYVSILLYEYCCFFIPNWRISAWGRFMHFLKESNFTLITLKAFLHCLVDTKGSPNPPVDLLLAMLCLCSSHCLDFLVTFFNLKEAASSRPCTKYKCLPSKLAID